jgi:hypothetical protein
LKYVGFIVLREKNSLLGVKYSSDCKKYGTSCSVSGRWEREKNTLYILTILKAIEKIFIYSSGFEDEKTFYSANKQLYFNATVNLLIVNWRGKQKN